MALTLVVLPCHPAMISTARGAEAGRMLGDLECVAIEVEEVGQEGEEIGLTKPLLESYVRMGAKAKLPRLRVDASCQSYLYLNLNMIKGDSVRGPERVYYGAMRLELRRLGTAAESKETGIMTVWDRGVLLTGLKESFRGTAIDQVEDLMSLFAAGYHEAGNR